MHALALQAVTAFNLVCTGTEVVGPMSIALVNSPDAVPYQVTYRIDLSQQRWCSHECETTRYIASVSEIEIVLETTTPGARPESGVRLNRETGRFLDLLLIGNNAVLRQGTCEPAPFTGFPARRF